MWNSVKKIFKRKYRFALFMLLLQGVALYCDIKYFPHIYGLSEFVEIMYTSLISFAAMWITCYLLIAQVFKDRYSLKNVENARLSPMLNQLTDIIVAVLLGAVIIFAGFGLLTPLTYSFLTIIIIIRILKSARDTVKNMMTNTSVDSLFLKAGNEVLKKGELSAELMRDISDNFEECIIKEDNCVVENIITKTEGLYKLTYESNIDEQKKEEILQKLLHMFFMQISELRLSDAEGLKNKMFATQENIAYFLIDKKDDERFKKTLIGFSANIFRIQTENDDIPREFIKKAYRPYFAIFHKLITGGGDQLVKDAFAIVADLWVSVKNNHYDENNIFMAKFVEHIITTWYFKYNKLPDEAFLNLLVKISDVVLNIEKNCILRGNM